MEAQPQSQLAFRNPFVGVPQSTKTLAAALGVFTLIGLAPGADEFFALNVGYTIPPHFYIWNVVTSGFYESSILSAVFSIMLLVFSGKYFEPIWGPREFLKFVMIVNIAAGIMSFVLMVVLYAIVRNEWLMFRTNLCGFSGVIAGFTVAMKQLVPEQEVRLIPQLDISIRAKNLPVLMVLMGVAFFALGFPSKGLPHVLFGTISSWAYLRFYQHKGEGSDVVGDLSESFSFATFFPEPLQPLISSLTSILSSPLRILGLCNPRGRGGAGSSSDTGSMIATPTTSYQPDAERRRALALRALDLRMAASPSSPPPSPTDDSTMGIMVAGGNNNNQSSQQPMMPHPQPPYLHVTQPRVPHSGPNVDH